MAIRCSQYRRASIAADQVEPVRRRVALKIIRPGMDGKQVIARFEAERQALALMDHPNIAKVLDAGATESDRPYFVMELVKGIPITQYCDEKRLTTHERLQFGAKKHSGLGKHARPACELLTNRRSPVCASGTHQIRNWESRPWVRRRTNPPKPHTAPRTRDNELGSGTADADLTEPTDDIKDPLSIVLNAPRDLVGFALCRQFPMHLRSTQYLLQ